MLAVSLVEWSQAVDRQFVPSRAALNIPPHQLDEALRHVQQGLMQPADAAKWLLEQSSADTPQFVPQLSRSQPLTIADLLDQLGPPPDEIQRDWDEQLASIAFEFERSTGQPFPEVSIHDILVDPNNRLTLSSAVHAGRENQSLTSHVAQTVSMPTNRSHHDSSSFAPRKNVLSRTSNWENPNRFSKYRWLQPTAVAFVAALTLGLTLYCLTPSEESKPVEATARRDSIFSPTINHSNTQSSSHPSNPRRADREASPAVNAATTEFELADESALMTPSTEPTSSRQDLLNQTAGEQPLTSNAMLGLDSFGGGNWSSGNDLLPTADFDTAITEVGTIDSIPDDDDSTDGTAMASAAQINEAPDSPTSHASGATSVELPSIPTRAMAEDKIEPVSIAELPVDRVEMLFPAESGLSLSSDNGSWVVQDSKDKATLATFVAGENDLQFRWTMLAATRPVAKQTASAMLNLSLRNGTSRPLFLRPVVNAEAWPIDFTTGDAKAAWPITTSPPFGAAKLNVEFHIPETVVQSWVQPHDPTQVRRSQSIIEFTLPSDSKIAIRSRLELKTGTRITLRMRHAAQLDPSFPWQMISTTRVHAAIEQVTNQLTLALAEQDRIKAIYSKASSSEKKFLVSHRDSIDTVVLQLQDLSLRLSKYDQLLSQLDHLAHMTIHLDVAWPDSAPLANQVIFAMNAPPESNP